MYKVLEDEEDDSAMMGVGEADRNSKVSLLLMLPVIFGMNLWTGSMYVVCCARARRRRKHREYRQKTEEIGILFLSLI